MTMSICRVVCLIYNTTLKSLLAQFFKLKIQCFLNSSVKMLLIFDNFVYKLFYISKILLFILRKSKKIKIFIRTAFDIKYSKFQFGNYVVYTVQCALYTTRINIEYRYRAQKLVLPLQFGQLQKTPKKIHLFLFSKSAKV